MIKMIRSLREWHVTVVFQAIIRKKGKQVGEKIETFLARASEY